MKIRTEKEIAEALAILAIILTEEKDPELLGHAGRAFEILNWVSGEPSTFGDFIDSCDLDVALGHHTIVTE